MRKKEQIYEDSFKGENVYVGIDVHLRQWHVSVQTESIAKKPFCQSPNAKTLLAYLTREFPGADYYSAYECGFCGFSPHYELEKCGIHNIVFNPADISDTQRERRRKTDALDASKICRNLMKGELTPIYVPGKEVEGHRNLLKLRENTVKSSTRTKNRIKSLLYRNGSEYPEQFKDYRSHWTKAFKTWLREESKNMTLESGYVMRDLVDELERLQKKVNALNRELCSVLKRYYPQEDMLLRSIPGIGRLTSAALCMYIVDINRFESDDDLASYVGLVPDTRSSGEHEKNIGLTFRSNRILRSRLIESSWVAISKDPALSLAFTNYCKRGKERNVAIIRIARKLVNRIRFVLRSGNKYELRIVK